MKRKLTVFFYFITSTAVFSLMSCNKDIETAMDFSSGSTEQEVLTKADDIKYQVSLADVEWLIISLCPEAGNYEIEAYPDNDTPIMYAVNFDEGWKIVSGDKRTSPILAYNDKDHITLAETGNPGLQFWLDAMAESLKSIDENDKESEANMMFWNTPSNLDEEGWTIETKAGNLWYRQLVSEYTSSYGISNGSASVGVIWGQGTPWNYKTPVSNGYRCPTGCVAVALAQIFRYLHYSIGVPSGLFHNVGYNNSGQFYRSDYNSNSTRWDDMAIDKFSGVGNTDYVGDLMIDIGQRVNMQYHYLGSGVDSTIFVTNALQYYGLTGTQTSFMYNTVKQDIINLRPVYICGFNNSNNTNGHAWVCDGYDEIGTITHRIYIWHEAYSGYSGELFTSAQAQATLDEGIVLSEGIGYCEDTNNPATKYLHMNWGWDGSNNGWFIFPNQWGYGNGDFSYSVEIISGIQALS